MSKTVKNRLVDARKWLEKKGESGSTVKPAVAAIEGAEKSLAEVATLRAKLKEATNSREQALATFKVAMENVRLEKKLKAKEAKVKSRLSNLVGTNPQK